MEEIHIINSARLLLKSFRELPCQFVSVSRTQEEWLLLVSSVIYLPSAKRQKLLWRHSILNAHCKHIACRVTAFVSEILNLLIIGFYLLHICNSYRPKRLTDLLKFLEVLQIQCKKRINIWFGFYHKSIVRSAGENP